MPAHLLETFNGKNAATILHARVARRGRDGATTGIAYVGNGLAKESD